MSSMQLKSHGGTQRIMDGYVTGSNGSIYPLTALKPYLGLLSPQYFSVLADGKSVVDNRSLEVTTPHVYRADYDNGSIVLAQKDELDRITSIEIHTLPGEPNTYLSATVGANEGELLTFTDYDFDLEMLNAEILLEDIDVDEELKKQQQEQQQQQHNQNEPTRHRYLRRSKPINDRHLYDLAMGKCSFYQTVKVGVVFDAEFCAEYGSFEMAKSRIMMIIASASIIYERDLCVKLELTDMFTPESHCDTASTPSYFKDFTREKACGRNNPNTFLKDVAEWMNENRDSYNLDEDAVFHFFSGHPHSGTLGCAYVGVVCVFPDFSYGVEYMTFTKSLQTQSIVYAHELGHSLNATHVPRQGNRYLMEAALNNPNNGFSQQSANKILGFLDSPDVQCDGIAYPDPTMAPSFNPTTTPSTTPSMLPSSLPSAIPTVTPSVLPSLNPSVPPTGTPTVQPSDSPSMIPSVDPTSNPSLEPSFIPSAIPTLTPSADPTNSPSSTPQTDPPVPPIIACDLEKVNTPSQCIFQSNDNRFACYNIVDLTSVQPSNLCQNNQPMLASIIVDSCTIHYNDRNLKEKTRKMNIKQSFPMKTIQQEQSARQDLEISNDEDPFKLKAFVSEDCSSECLQVGEFICVLANNERNVDLSFHALTNNGTTSTEFTTRLPIVLDEYALDETETCSMATTTCIQL